MLSFFFHYFKSDINKIELPNQFDYPHYYIPHELAKLASLELQNELPSINFCHNFGLDETDSSMPIGKMFGVLVVQNNEGEIGYLRGFSGKIGESNWHQGFVPPIYDLLKENGFFKEEEKVINKINSKIEKLEKSLIYLDLKDRYQKSKEKVKSELADIRSFLKLKKQERNFIRQTKKKELTDEEYILLLEQLKVESINQQLDFKRLSLKLNLNLDEQKKEIEPIENEITKLKSERKQKSNNLQDKIFNQYIFINKFKEQKSLLSIFQNTVFEKPPAGAGECVAPKLFNFAFQHDLTPICMAEFWWGKSPESEIRLHKQFYPACKGKCEPILNHMLSKSDIALNPMLIQKNIDHLEIIYEDDWIVAVNKPNDFLSVPGKNLSDSILTRLKIKYPDATGPLLLHRLDMSTSGILIAAKNKEIHELIQKQFIHGRIKKSYLAILDGIISQKEGEINLPLTLDVLDRPKQMVCFENGKSSKTEFKLLKIRKNKSLIEFWPKTGRTHQLRVHSAHKLGLNTPILGDDLYGNRDTRLYLHAKTLTFYHPILKKEISLEAKCEFLSHFENNSIYKKLSDKT